MGWRNLEYKITRCHMTYVTCLAGSVSLLIGFVPNPHTDSPGPWVKAELEEMQFHLRRSVATPSLLLVALEWREE